MPHHPLHVHFNWEIKASLNMGLAKEIKWSQTSLRECEDEIHTPEMGTWESSETPKTSEFDYRGQNIGVFFISLESYRSVDVENELAWAIWTFVTQVMTKRRAMIQIGNLTPGH